LAAVTHHCSKLNRINQTVIKITAGLFWNYLKASKIAIVMQLQYASNGRAESEMNSLRDCGNIGL